MKKAMVVIIASIIFLFIPLNVAALSSKQQEKQEKIINEIMSLINVDMSDIEKVVILHDWLTKNVRYDHATFFSLFDPEYAEKENPLSYTPYGAFVNKLAVCDGYTKAYQVLLNRAGIENKYISGYAWGMRYRHSWNMVKLSGKWYHIDVTWDSGKYNIDNDYGYFLLADDLFSHTDHYWESEVKTAKKSFFGQLAPDKDNIYLGISSQLKMLDDKIFFFSGCFDTPYSMITLYDIKTKKLHTISKKADHIDSNDKYICFYDVDRKKFISFNIEKMKSTVISKLSTEGAGDLDKLVLAGDTLFYKKLDNTSFTYNLVDGQTNTYEYVNIAYTSSNGKYLILGQWGWDHTDTYIYYSLNTENGKLTEIFTERSNTHIKGAYSYKNKTYMNTYYDIYCFDEDTNAAIKLKRPPEIVEKRYANGQADIQNSEYISKIFVVEENSKTYLYYRIGVEDFKIKIK